VDLTTIAAALESTAFAEWMRTSLKAMPVIEAIHVMAVAVVFGTNFIVDLPLLGYTHTRRPFTLVSGELLRLTWAGFAVAVATGAMMFVPNASTYIGNTPFWLKMGALAGAGLNMALFQTTTFRSVASWDAGRPVPVAGRIAGALSIVLWTGVIFFGRWIGFTKGYDFAIPDDFDFDFDIDFLGSCLRGLRDLLDA
jgi:hypothetical protein